jgi:putative nucleotidyltransferase with HDIG domain
MSYATPDGELAALPAAQARALSMLQNEDLDIRDLTAVIESDPALTGSVLRFANSAASAPVDPIATANEAIVRLGLVHTRQIVSSAIVGSSFGDLGRAQIDANELWRHLIACALIGDHVTWGGEQRSSAFTAGLMHDIGRLALASAEPSRYAQAVARARETGDLMLAEINVFGRDHQEWGVRIAQGWGLPEEIIEAIGDHHHGTAGPLSWAIQTSRRIADSLGIGDGVMPASVPVAPRSAAADDLPGGEPWPDDIEQAEEDAAVLASLGGAEELFDQIDWFTSTIAGAARAA